MPLIQEEIATVMGAPLHDVRVGVYAFADEVYESECYNSAAVSKARAELVKIAKALPR